MSRQRSAVVLIVFNFMPHLETFYRDWLKRPLPGDRETVAET